MSGDAPTHPVDTKSSRPTWLAWLVAIVAMIAILVAIYWFNSPNYY
jgi:hypothetical protein